MNEKEYLVLVGKGNLYPLKQKFKDLGGFWTRICWVFPEQSESQLSSIVRQLPNYEICRQPLGEKTFEEYRQSFKASFFKKQLKVIERQIDEIKTKFSIVEISEETICLINGDEETKNQLLTLLQEKERLEDSIKWCKDLESALSIQLQKNLSIVPIDERIKSLNEMLNLYRGKKYLGLCVKTIEEFNNKLKGLRKLILLAAAPGVGKTALTIQLGLESLAKEKDACLVYISLEMTSVEIFTRMNLNLSGLDFDSFVLGREQVENEKVMLALFSEEELKKIEETSTHLKEEIGDRLQIIDIATCPNIDADIVISYIDHLKNKTKCSRAIVIIDYLQVWPIPQDKRFSDIEADKWRIGEIKKIKEALNKVNQDPVIVISESRKPSSNEGIWGGDLADVMGSARGTYTPDVVILFSPLQPKAIKKLWGSKKMPKILPGEEQTDIEDEDEKEGAAIISFLASEGISFCKLKIPKCRDGMKRFNILIAFHIYKNTFTYINWKKIEGLCAKYKDKKCMD